MSALSENKIQAARTLCDKGLWPDVLAFAQKWHAENPADAKALFFQGVALAAAGRFVEAETTYRRALKLDDTDFKAWNNLAGVLFDSLDKPMDAIRCMEQALKLEPQNKLGWSNLANLAGRLGKHDQALECAQRALALDPHMVEAQLHRARAAQALGKTEILRSANETLATLPPERFRRTH